MRRNQNNLSTSPSSCSRILLSLCSLFIHFLLCERSFCDQISSNHVLTGSSATYFRRGSNVNLYCGTNSSSNISLVRWGLPNNTTFRKNVLRLPLLDFGDAGRYVCVAYSLGEISYNLSTEIIVQDVPDPPPNITLVASSASSLAFSWTRGDDHFRPVLLHTLYLSKDNHLVQQTNVTSPTNEFTFRGLEPRTCYSLIIRALNGIGWSIFTKATHVLTLPGLPDAPPLLMAHEVTNTTIQLRVDLATPIHVNSTPTHCLLLSNVSSAGFYVVNVSRGVGNMSVVERYEFEINSRDGQVLSIGDLKPFTSYRISTAVVYDQLESPTAHLSVRTLEGYADPPILSSHTSATNSISIRWNNGPNLGGVLIGYKLELYPCGSGENHTRSIEALRLRKQQVGSVQRFYTFRGLDADACYAVRIASGTKVGFGTFSPLYEVQTDISAPKLLSAKFLDTNGILLNWTCTDQCGPLNFVICWSSSSDGQIPECQSPPINPDASQHVYCNCHVNPQFQTTVLPWSALESLQTAKRAKFVIRSVRRYDACSNEHTHCDQQSEDSNSVVLDLDSAPARWRNKSPPGFQVDNVAVISIISMTALLFILVTFVACLSNRMKCMLVPCKIPFSFNRHTDPSVWHKHRRAIPLRFNRVKYKPIAQVDLLDYVTSTHSDCNAGFQLEFDAIEQSVVSNEQTTHVAKLSENLGKNRYSNILAYDQTRVILKGVGNKSDYINANYIDGYHRRAAYIAAQGPIPTTFDDFWLMVWEQTSNVIVMISNFIERGRRKCDQYWPSSGQQCYGNISVRLLSEVVRAFYTVRVFLIRHLRMKRGAKERRVYHYQYTDWRDFDVPPSPLPVLKFIEFSIEHWSMDDGPIVVHCSAGVGRTGTYICIESLIRQLKSENSVTIRSYLEHIRQQRMKLVQTEQQYVFIHDALCEYVLYPSHVIRPNHFSDYLHHLRELDSSGWSNLERQYELCKEVSPKHLVNGLRSIQTCPNISSRFMSNNMNHDASEDTYSFPIHGFRMLSEYMVAFHPSMTDNGERAFWKMIWDENSSIIICLSSSNVPPFWPTVPAEVLDIGWLHVSYVSSNKLEDSPLSRYEFLLTSDREDYALACTLWHLPVWPSSGVIDSKDDVAAVDSLLDLASHIVEDCEDPDDIHSANGPITVVDDHRGRHAAAFCALRICIDQFTHDFTFDVYFVVKMICLQYPAAFLSYHDLEFIYTLLQHYLTKRDTSAAWTRSFNLGTLHGTENQSTSNHRPFDSHPRYHKKVVVSHLFANRVKPRINSNASHVTSTTSLQPTGRRLSSSPRLVSLGADDDDLPSTGQLESISRHSLIPSASPTISLRSQSPQLFDDHPSSTPHSTLSLPVT